MRILSGEHVPSLRRTHSLIKPWTFRFHLSDGTVYTHLDGTEYEDIAAAWDWNLIPGTTTDYGATPLNCATVSKLGLESFVGGVSDGVRGIGAMRYTNPTTRALNWQKAWFFVDGDAQHVMINNISSTSTGFEVWDAALKSKNAHYD